MHGNESDLITNLAILVLAASVGYAVISKVPNTLHTPLMSGTNAIHGIVVLGGLLIIGTAGDGFMSGCCWKHLSATRPCSSARTRWSNAGGSWTRSSPTGPTTTPPSHCTRPAHGGQGRPTRCWLATAGAGMSHDGDRPHDLTRVRPPKAERRKAWLESACLG